MSSYPCISCDRNISGRSHAIQCDECDRWQHRKCGTGITHIQYRQLQREEINLDWKCIPCSDQTNLPAPEDQTNLPEPEDLHVPEPEDLHVPEPEDQTNLPEPEDQTNLPEPEDLHVPEPEDLHVPIPIELENDVETILEIEPTNRIPDTSFDIGDISINEVPLIPDEELADRPPGEVVTVEAPKFQVVEKGTKLGAKMLVSSCGYTYNVRRENSQTRFIYWVCSVRTKSKRCPVWVKQYGEDYVESNRTHDHPPDVHKAGTLTALKMIKEKSDAQKVRPAGQIVNEVLREMAEINEHCRIKPENLRRAANRHRHKNRPSEPKANDLDFTVDLNYIGDDQFLFDDIRIEGARHLLFATNIQLQHLTRARRWFIDGTFKIVNKPFYQLMTIHAYLCKDDDVKQVPLVFVLMSRRQKRDYVAVFQSIIQKLEEPLVEWIMLDFEAAAWQAIRELLRVVIRGCAFHWTQGVYRNIMRLGLGPSYTAGGDVYSFLRKVMALPFVPPEHIPQAFGELKNLAQMTPNDQMNSFLRYVQNTWIDGNMWKPEHWSVFMEHVRTNNDVEGWHRGLNCRANGAKLPFYVMLPLLKSEAEHVTIAARLVSANLVSRNQRTKYKRIHGRLFQLWNEYEDKSLTTSRLLREVSHLIGLGPNLSSVNDARDASDD